MNAAGRFSAQGDLFWAVTEAECRRTPNSLCEDLKGQGRVRGLCIVAKRKKCKELALDPSGSRQLRLRLGAQVNVPTMPFIAHLIQTAQGMTDDMDKANAASASAPRRRESVAERSHARVLKQLNTIGFDPEVLEAIAVIKMYAAK